MMVALAVGSGVYLTPRNTRPRAWMTTSVLFGLEDEFVVSSVERLDHRPVVRVKGLDASGQAVELWWRKRRLRRLEPPCPL